jgi:hypothetical protein
MDKWHAVYVLHVLLLLACRGSSAAAVQCCWPFAAAAAAGCCCCACHQGCPAGLVAAVHCSLATGRGDDVACAYSIEELDT